MEYIGAKELFHPTPQDTGFRNTMEQGQAAPYTKQPIVMDGFRPLPNKAVPCVTIHGAT